MKPDKEAELISMGMDLGMYAFATLMATGTYQMTSAMWDRLAQECANNLERETGMPAEDIALNAMPMIEAAMTKIIGGNK